jgi:hypothetical protein
MGPASSMRMCLAAQDDPAADARADLDEEEVVDAAGGPCVELAERHDVHVVVDHDGRAEGGREGVADGEAVPARHDRRHHGGTLALAHRARDADADTVQLLRGAVGAQLGDEVHRLLEHDLGASPHVGWDALVGEQAHLAVRDRDVDGSGPDVDADEAQGPREPDEVGATPSAGLRETLSLDQAEFGEPVEFDGDLGLREPDCLAELGPRCLATVAEQAQQASLVTVLGPCPDSVHPRPHLLERLGNVSRRLRASAFTGKTSSRESSKCVRRVTGGGRRRSLSPPSAPCTPLARARSAPPAAERRTTGRRTAPRGRT